MYNYYLAIDIGASSGRHVLGHMEDGKIILEEIHRFDNGMVKKDGVMCWDLEHIFNEIKIGLKKCYKIGKIPSSIGVDTWAVDFVLLDIEGNVIGNTVGYRDDRTRDMDKLVYEIIDQDKLYKKTGIQKQIFNTIYQLMSVKQNNYSDMESAEDFMMIPDYINYLLTGVKKTEYTNATTTQLVSPITKNWDYQLIEELGYKKTIFKDITLPGSIVGKLREELVQELGFDTEVVQTTSHDTASAVVAVPSIEEDFLYLSSGTWSLMGVEQKEANCSALSMKANMTNEGGYEYRFRYLKNIMGLWIIQSIRHELDDSYSFSQICKEASRNSDFPSRIDVNDVIFLAPENMIDSIKKYCEDSGQKIPNSIGEIATVVYQSLADSYKSTVEEIESITGKKFDKIHIVGGGSNADYLNELTAKATGKTVYAGPSEATAIGNLVVQMIKATEFVSLSEARKCIFESFEIKEYTK